MSIELEYIIYCIEEYKRRHGMSGKETYRLFEQSGASQYIIDHYDALHTAGIEYTLDDIEGIIQTIEVRNMNQGVLYKFCIQVASRRDATMK